MRLEEIRNSLIPSIFSFTAIMYLVFFSGLSISKAISVENQVTISFMNTLSENDILLAIVEVLRILFFQAVLPLLPFLSLISAGFLIAFAAKEKMNLKLFFALQAIFLLAAAILSNFSIVIIIICVGVLAVSISVLKTIEEKKSNFSTGQSVTWRSVDWINISIAIGVFLAIYLNLQSYQQAFVDSNMQLVKNFMPNTDQLQNLESQVVNNTVEGIKASLRDSCQQNETQIRLQCQVVYQSISDGLDNYRQNATEQFKVQNITDQDMQVYVMKAFPAMNQLTKAMPLFLALSLFALMEVVKPFIALAFGGFYSLAKKLI